MHRSGTSAAAGTIEQHGVTLGEVVTQSGFQPKGNRENPRMIRLHERILKRHGGSWWDPPDPERIELREGDFRRRDRLLSAYPRGAEPIGIKEPRMLIAMALWRELDLRPIGVLRNPLSVRESLQARARERGRPEALLDDARCEALWCAYNAALLAEHRRAGGFPIVDFDRPESFAAGVEAALRRHGLGGAGASDPEDFFEGGATSSPPEDWRRRVASGRALELHAELAEMAFAPSRAAASR